MITDSMGSSPGDSPRRNGGQASGRVVGDALMGLGAYRHSVPLLVAGAAVIAAGWSPAAWPRA